MFRNHNTQITAVVLAVLIGLSLFSGGVAAADDGYLGGFAEPADDGPSWLPFDVPSGAQIAETVSGMSDRAKHRIMGPESTAAESATAVQEEYNDHSTAYETYVNHRVTADTDHDVVELTLTLDDTSETVYWVADVNSTDDTFENTSIVDNTDRTVDQTVALDGIAAENAADELTRFHDDYVVDNTTPKRGDGYLTGLGARYAGHAQSSLIDIKEDV